MKNERILSPRRFMRPLMQKAVVEETELHRFSERLDSFVEAINSSESEEHSKENIASFLRNTHYREDKYRINTHDRIDLVIREGEASPPKVLFEVKRPEGNRSEMCRVDRLNAKALQELLWYFMQERESGNLSLTHLVVTNSYEWFVFDARLFDDLFYQDKPFHKAFSDFTKGKLLRENTDTFYKDIAAPAIDAAAKKLQFCHFDLRKYNRKAQSNLVALYKLFSPEQLLKKDVGNDSNSLNKDFYLELLHILGLTEVKEKGKKLIRRAPAGHREEGSLIENTIEQLRSHNKVIRLQDREMYGESLEDQLYNVALELSITWVNRILFLKLLEAQLQQYHGGDSDCAFLKPDQIADYDDVDKLFFQVLARLPAERRESVQSRYAKVPYLNSSLFEPTELEQQTVFIGNLEDRLPLSIYKKTKLLDGKKRRTGSMDALSYLLRFLDAYDFGAEGVDEVRAQKRTLINASVLGLIFEKINGYRDGSFFTPGYITEYMAQQTIERAVVAKFNEAKGWECEDIGQLYNKINSEDIPEANEIFNRVHICDPAVGSGHFLVSTLNVLLELKSRLGILVDEDGRRLRDYKLTIDNDELLVQDETDALFKYQPNSPESQRVQRTLFQEKRTLIESCLFGVDINPNSVKICRLRLWIELLKNAYYREDGQLETLPNIDINIGCGNSLVARAPLSGDLQAALLRSKWNIRGYRALLQAYRSATNKEEKMRITQEIKDIRDKMHVDLSNAHPLIKKREKTAIKLDELIGQGDFFANKDEQTAEIEELTTKLASIEEEIKAYQANTIFRRAFEWRFEFPEVLDDEGNFIGFDVVIGNPPYIRQEELKEFKDYFKANFETYAGTADLYVYFVEQGLNLLKDGGQFAYIIPNKWMRAGYGRALRQKLRTTKVIGIRDFGDLPVFEEATTYPCIVEAENSVERPEFFATLVKSLDFDDSLHSTIRNTSFRISQASILDEGLVLVNPEVQKILDKMRSSGIPLKEIVNQKIFRGILTGLNDAFVINEDIKNKLISEDPNAAEIIQPFLAGRDIKRYQSPVSAKWLIFTRRGIEIENYPSVLVHLEQFRTALEPKPKDYSGSDWPGRKAGNYKWYELQDAVEYYQLLEEPKILYQEIAVSSNFTIDTSGLYANNKVFFIRSGRLDLLGLLNSKAVWFYLLNTANFLRGGLAMQSPYVLSIPVPESLNEKADLLESLVRERLSAAKGNATILDQRIDQVVYGLFDLSNDEISIVEAAS